MPEAIIRPAKASDFDAVIEICRISWEGQGANWLLEQHFGQLDNKSWIDHFAKGIRDKFDKNPDWVWVTECNNQIAAFVSCTIHEELSLGTIGHNAAHPDFRGKGLGKAQIEFLTNHLQALGLEHLDVIVTVNPGHMAARGLYASQGCKLATKLGIHVAQLADIHTPEPVGVRYARDGDASAIRALLAESLKASHKYAVAEICAKKPLGGIGWLDRICAEINTENTIVTEQDDCITGVAMLSPSGNDIASVPLNTAITTSALQIIAGQLGFAARKFVARGAKILQVFGAYSGDYCPIAEVCQTCGITTVKIDLEYRFGSSRKPAMSLS
jgi:ribosomal protein S18 acetylase RimI-like enzyme